MKLRPSPSRRSEQGSILIVSLCTMMIIGLALLTYLTLVKNQNQLVVRSQVWNACMPVAEAGVEDALNHCAWTPSNSWASSGWTLSSSNTLYRSNIISATEGWYNVIIATNSMASNFVTITSTGYYPMPGSDATHVPRTVRVLALKVPVYTFAIYGRTSVDFNGNGIRIDSYDSRTNTKSTLGLYAAAKAGDKANIGTYNGSPGATYDLGNGNVWGKIYMGPNGKVSCGPNGAAGSVAWQTAGKKGVEPGWLRTDLNISIPDVKVPFSAGVPALPGIVGGVFYNQVFSSGTYVVANLNGKSIVTGDALIHVTGNFNSSLFVLQTNCSVIVYCGGNASFSDTDNQTQRAANFQMLGLPACKIFGVDDGFTGAVYAPDASITVNGNRQIYGSIAGNRVRLSGGSDLHFDEALGDPSSMSKRGYIITSWTEL